MGRQKNKRKESRKLTLDTLTHDEFMRQLEMFRPKRMAEEIKDYISLNSVHEFLYGHRPGSRVATYMIICENGDSRTWRSRYSKIVF